jgi:hypothetical protein
MTPPVTKRKTYTEDQREKAGLIIKNMLKKKYKHLKLDDLSIKENVREQTTEIICKLLFGKKKLTINGLGKGPVDALFTALINNFSDEYCSLKNLYCVRFSIEADVEKYLSSYKTDAAVEATLEITNSHATLLFRERASSINVVSVNVVLSSIEHFINAEKCVIILHRAIEDAKKRNRGDILNDCTRQLAEIVKNVSYENVIQKLKGE